MDIRMFYYPVYNQSYLNQYPFQGPRIINTRRANRILRRQADPYFYENRYVFREGKDTDCCVRSYSMNEEEKKRCKQKGLVPYSRRCNNYMADRCSNINDLRCNEYYAKTKNRYLYEDTLFGDRYLPLY